MDLMQQNHGVKRIEIRELWHIVQLPWSSRRKTLINPPLKLFVQQKTGMTNFIGRGEGRGDARYSTSRVIIDNSTKSYICLRSPYKPIQ